MTNFSTFLNEIKANATHSADVTSTLNPDAWKALSGIGLDENNTTDRLLYKYDQAWMVSAKHKGRFYAVGTLVGKYEDNKFPEVHEKLTKKKLAELIETEFPRDF